MPNPKEGHYVGILALTKQFTSGSSFRSLGRFLPLEIGSRIGEPGVVGGVKEGLSIDGGTRLPPLSSADDPGGVWEFEGGVAGEA